MNLHKLAGKLLYKAAEKPVGIGMILWCVNHMSWILPIKFLRETGRLIAMRNPEPSYPFHIIIMPKRPIRRLLDLTQEDGDLLAEVVQMVQSLVTEYQLQEQGFSLIVNGGKYQTVSQLHFHLVSGEPVRR